MPKPKIIIAVILVALVVGGAFLYSHTWTDQSLDGEYVLDTTDPLIASSVTIASSTPDRLKYVISTVSFGHTGWLEGVAARVVGTTTLSFVDARSNEGCSVLIAFPYPQALFYTTTDVAVSDKTLDYTPSCSDFHGAHGQFMDGEVHVKDGTVTLPTIEKLGFSQTDIKEFEQLIPGSIEGVQGFLDYKVEDEPSFVPLSSADIPGGIGYAIQTSNMYNGFSACDFSQSFGYCEYTAFIKNARSRYWVLHGTDGEPFSYATNDPAWKNKLPDAFRGQLIEMGIDPASVILIK